MSMLLPLIRPISDLRTDLNGICEEAREAQQPIFMTRNGKASLVMMDCDAYAVLLLCEMPDLGKPFEDDRLAVKGRRTHLVGSYRLFYSYSADALTVVWRVIHTARDIDDYALVDLADWAGRYSSSNSSVEK